MDWVKNSAINRNMRIKYLYIVIVRFISFLLICNINTYIIMCDEKF